MARPIGIRIHRGSELLEAQVFDRELIKIGRLTSAHLRLEDPKVSRIHAVIEFTDAREVSILTDDERPFVQYGRKGGK